MLAGFCNIWLLEHMGALHLCRRSSGDTGGAGLWDWGQFRSPGSGWEKMPHVEWDILPTIVARHDALSM